jgi:hypothetical protein
VSANKDAHYACKATHRALMRRPALKADFRGRIAPVEMHGAKLPGLVFSQERTEKVVRKIALGLHYHHTGKVLPTSVEAEVFYQPDKLLEDTLKLAQHKGYFGDSFSYAGAVSVGAMRFGGFPSMPAYCSLLYFFLAP